MLRDITRIASRVARLIYMMLLEKGSEGMTMNEISN
jgi:hypothetical protein